MVLKVPDDLRESLVDNYPTLDELLDTGPKALNRLLAMKLVTDVFAASSNAVSGVDRPPFDWKYDALSRLFLFSRPIAIW